ncbi:MAG TPA: hypothetical protein VMW65_02530, partial [Chloroflexota bacterium]|nr:hypothetical protein [Chloroflexota bacterium]
SSWTTMIRALPFVHDVTVSDSTLSVALDDPDVQNPPLVTALVQAGAQIRAVEPIAHSLEEVYLELTREESRVMRNE